jgi:2-polyprenyl-6-methoxyphenol hydroxylase-like FAD-dependent oxidoreductase
MAVTEHAVTVVGGGPAGMMLAAELTLAGVDVGLLERRERPKVESARGGGIYARTIEVLDQRGIAERFFAEGRTVPAGSFAEVPLDVGGLPTRHNYTLALWQNRIEHHLAAWVAELEVPIVRGCEVTGFRQDADGVDVALAGGGTLRTKYLVGCDGARSVIRKAAGIAFSGWDAVGSWMVAEVAMREEPQIGAHRDAKGVYAMGPLGDGRVRVVIRDERVATGDPTLDDLRTALVVLYGTDFGVHDPTWLSRFSDAARQATTYRDGRVLLAGDAAHVHGPVGGQGLNLGLQDAVNLGWKLARVVAGTAPDRLLDTYHHERHPVGARVLQLTLAMTALQRADNHMQALIATLADPLGCDEPRARLAARLVGLDIHYDLGDGHPLLGRRMPDLDLLTADGPTRVYELLRTARPVLLHLDGPAGPDIAGWAARVPVVAATAAGAWELPVLGTVAPPTAVLVRPDGYVAWVGEGTDAGLADAAATWFGPADDLSGMGRSTVRHSR